MPAANDAEQTNRERALTWVNDAPLFLDPQLLSAVYDAVVRPVYKEDAPIVIKLTDQAKKVIAGTVKTRGESNFGALLSSIASAKAEAELSGSKTGEASSSQEGTFILHPISTPQAQLEQLTIWYFFNSPDSLLVGDKNAPLHWQQKGLAALRPRPLAFIDLNPGTKMIPMAAEFVDGRVVTFFDHMRTSAGAYPEPYDPARPQIYWKWFDENFNPQKSIELIEAASTETKSKIAWIDFRVPINESVDTIHLHFRANGGYDVGVFAYYMIRRALTYGINIIGTLKSGPDFNVLAVHEK